MIIKTLPTDIVGISLIDSLSELVTGLKFTNDCRQLISVSGDGWVLWKVRKCSDVLTVEYNKQINNQGKRRSGQQKMYHIIMYFYYSQRRQCFQCLKYRRAEISWNPLRQNMLDNIEV